MNCYKKVFICEITETILNGENSNSSVIKTVMKSSVLGVITAIQKFSRRTIYTVDDGTGLLNCVLWHNDSVSAERINKIMMDLNADKGVSSDLNSTCQFLLNKVQINEEEPIYIHGDIICCLGIVKLVKGKLLLNINHHYKADDVDAETLWILDVISYHQSI